MQLEVINVNLSLSEAVWPAGGAVEKTPVWLFDIAYS